MSFEKAANPNKMADYLSSFNSANLGKVANAGTISSAMSDANTVLQNAAAKDIKDEMYLRKISSERSIDHRADMARMEMDANRTNAWISAGQSAALGAMKGSEFSLFDKGPDLNNVDVSSSAFDTARDEANSYFGSRI